MTVFISWSGERSKAVALIFDRYLKHVIQGLDVFISDRNIASGTQWYSEISDRLREATFGVICVTPANINQPWLNFEAGAIGNQAKQSRVAPVAIDMSKDDLPSPLNGFNAVDLNEDGFVRLVSSIHETVKNAAPWDIIEAAARRQWGDMEKELATLPAEPAVPAAGTPEFDLEDAVKEIRGLLRDLVRSPERRPMSFETSTWQQKALRDMNVKLSDGSELMTFRLANPSDSSIGTIVRLVDSYRSGVAGARESLSMMGVDPDAEDPVGDYMEEKRRRAAAAGPIADDESSGEADFPT